MTERKMAALTVVSAFQPLSGTEKAAVDLALAKAEHVSILIGSPNSARSAHLHPLDAYERSGILAETWETEIAAGRLTIDTIDDHLYVDRLWDDALRERVRAHGYDSGLVAIGKLQAKYFSRHLAGIKLVQSDASPRTPGSTGALLDYFLSNTPLPEDLFPPASVAFMARFTETPAYEALAFEAKECADYKALFKDLKWPPKFLTSDCLIEHAGHVLLVKRKNFPGKGQWAIPGGFLDGEERLYEAALRELREESGVDIDTSGLSSGAYLAAKEEFDLPHRDGRGRLVTMGYMFRLTSGTPPEAVAGDDAEDTWWAPLDGAIDPRTVFADHLGIIEQLTRMVGLQFKPKVSVDSEINLEQVVLAFE